MIELNKTNIEPVMKLLWLNVDTTLWRSLLKKINKIPRQEAWEQIMDNTSPSLHRCIDYVAETLHDNSK